MIKRVLSFALALFLVTVTAFGVELLLPHMVVEDGNSVLRTFKLAGESDSASDYFRQCLEDPRNVVLYSNSGIWEYSFLVVPPGCNLILKNSLTPGNIQVQTSPTVEVRIMTFQYDSGNFILSSDDLCYGIDKVRYIVAGRYFNSVNYSFPSLAYDYLLDVPGNLLIEWDLQDGNPDDGILGWLGDFWQKFIDTVKGLFVPSKDYFPDFFEEIKTAFEEKLGGLGDLLDSMSGMFDSLKNASKESSLVIEVPDNQLFPGYQGITVDVLKPIRPMLAFLRGVFNAMLIVFTVIQCYHKLNEIIDT